jgi:hypothetical protein
MIWESRLKTAIAIRETPMSANSEIKGPANLHNCVLISSATYFVKHAQIMQCSLGSWTYQSPPLKRLREDLLLLWRKLTTEMVLFVVHDTDEVADVITAFFLEMPTQHGKAGWLERWKPTLP